MLLRSSSAPVLSSLDLSRELDPFPNDFPHLPAFESPLRCSNFDRLRRAQSETDLRSLSNGVACVHASSSLISPLTHETERNYENCSASFKQWTKRVSLQRKSSGFDAQDSILEENELLNLGSIVAEESLQSEECLGEISDPSGSYMKLETAQEREQLRATARGNSESATSVSKSGRTIEGFLLGDGEVYTSLNVDANGSPVVCNSKGCRPLADHEREKLGPMYMASGLGLCTGGGAGYGGRSSTKCGDGGLGPESNSIEAYYQRQLHADPQNPLLLRNYANFLLDAKGDYKSSEEYYERAILACPSDGEVLSQYAKLQWDVHRDEDRAELYYNQAIKAAPDDSHVLASYASFLWDSEDPEDADPAFSAMLPSLHGAPHASSPLMASA